MAEQKKQELQEYELEQVTGGIRLVGISAPGWKGDLFRVLDEGGQPVTGKQMVITIEGQEYKVITGQDGGVHLPLFIGAPMVVFQKARIRLLDDACKG